MTNTTSTVTIPSATRAELKEAEARQLELANAKKLAEAKELLATYEKKIEDSKAVASAFRALAIQFGDTGNTALSVVTDAINRARRHGEDQFYYRNSARESVNQLSGTSIVPSDEI